MRVLFSLVAIPLVLFTSIGITGAEEKTVVPGAPRLLPEKTLAYIRIENVTEFREGLAASSTGKMLADPKLKPIASEVYVIAADAFQTLGDRIGLSLDELMSIPKGQLALALISKEQTSSTDKSTTESTSKTPKDDSPEAIRKRIEEKQKEAANVSFGGLILIETGDDDSALKKILSGLEKRMTQDGFVSRQETISGTSLVRLVRTNNPRESLEYFRRDGVTVIGIGTDSARDSLDRWNGVSDGRTLAESTDFAAVMSRCIGEEETRPQVTFFVNPYTIVERLVKSSGGGAVIVWPIIENLGVGKIRGIGGSIFQGGDTFDDISHMHVLLDPPRDGIFGVVRPSKVDTNPPDWVPADVTSYVSLGWRVDAAFDGFERIFDRFSGEGSFNTRTVEPFKTQTGLDLREALVNTTKDRGVMISWLQKPVTFNSSTSLVGIQLKDPAEMSRTIEKLRESVWKGVETDSIGATKIYRGPQRDQPMPPGFRAPTPCAAIVGDWLMATDSRELLEHVIRSNNGAVPRLSSLPEYDLVASEVGAQLDAEKPFMFSFARQAEVLRQFYDLAKSPQVRDALKGPSENNPIAKRIMELLAEDQLPPFDEFKKYFAPSGGFAYDEPTGMHFGRYTLKADD